jgi:hypothetical protein
MCPIRKSPKGRNKAGANIVDERSKEAVEKDIE